MQERITFVHGPEDPFDPKQLSLRDDTLHVQSLKAAREDRVTLSLYELPQEIWRALKQCYELHIRWVSARPFTATAPFVSTLPPGLHIFFTPQQDRPADLLCPLLRKIFGNSIACTSPKDAFISIPILSQRFASTAAYQYHNRLDSLEDLITYITQKVCAGDALCINRAEKLKQGDYFDFDYDTISQSVTLSAYWHKSPSSDSWNEKINNRKGSVKVEVGVLANEEPTQPEEISLGGFLATIGVDSRPNPTLFSFPSRHHPASANFSAGFVQPTGLHPTLRVTMPRSLISPSPECALHAYLTIPSFLFVDQYQLASPNHLASKNLCSIRSLSGETDLEAPDWAISKWGFALLLELAPPETVPDSKAGDFWHAEIPLHLRYLRPLDGPRSPPDLNPGDNCAHRTLPVAWPNVFWACPTDEGTKMNTNPFDRVNLGYDGLFGPRTMFYHLQSASYGKPLIEQLKAPTIDLTDVKWIEFGTVSAVLLGFIWVLWKVLRVIWKDLWYTTDNGQKKED